MVQYQEYWGITHEIFGRSAESANIFLPATWRDSVDRLTAVADQGQKLIVLVGAPGCGKTTLAKWLYHNLPQDSHDILLLTLLQNAGKPGWLLPRLSEYLGVGSQPLDTERIMSTVKKLDDYLDTKRRLLCIVDAAERLQNAAAYEEIITFLNLQAIAGHCLSFVLVGNHKLDDVVSADLDLKNKVSLRLQVAPFEQQTTIDYIKFCLELGKLPAQTFNDEAFAKIFQLTGGNIQQINNLCENSLMEAAVRGINEVDADVVAAAENFVYSAGEKPVPKPEQRAADLNTFEEKTKDHQATNNHETSLGHHKPKDEEPQPLSSLFKIS